MHKGFTHAAATRLCNCGSPAVGIICRGLQNRHSNHLFDLCSLCGGRDCSYHVQLDLRANIARMQIQYLVTTSLKQERVWDGIDSARDHKIATRTPNTD